MPGKAESSSPANVLRLLLAERGVTDYTLWGSTGEGQELPNGHESCSGHVIDWEHRTVHFVLDGMGRTRAAGSVHRVA
jgi:hypothetical protein